jgi:hypothetical protein
LKLDNFKNSSKPENKLSRKRSLFNKLSWMLHQLKNSLNNKKPKLRMMVMKKLLKKSKLKWLHSKKVWMKALRRLIKE